MVSAVVVGLGSMGRRRLRCLEALGASAILGVDPRADRRRQAHREHGVPTAPSLTAESLACADALIISTPPDLHARYIRRAIEARVPCFVEASVVLDDLPALAVRARRRKSLVFPSCTMRYFAGPRRVRELVRAKTVGAPLSFIYHTGQYLPDWHPWEKVSDFYVSSARTGGCREIVPFELAWLVWAFGPVRRVKALIAQKDRFGKGVEDLYQFAAEFASGVHGLIQVDVLARLPVRRFALEGTKGRLVWDQYGGGGPAVWVQKAGGKEKRERLVERAPASRGINSDAPYINELGDFLKAVRGRRAPAYSLQDDVEVLETLELIRRQARA